MRKILIFAFALTSLFLSAMPLHAAYAQTPEQNKVETPQACSTMLYSDFASEDQVEKLKAQGGAFVVLSAQSDIQRFRQRWEKKTGEEFPQKSPEEFDMMLVVISDPNAAAANIFTFKDNCLLKNGAGHFPIDAVPYMLSDGDPV